MASDTLRAGQLICDSTTPPPDRGFFKINDTTTGHVGKLVILDPITEKQSQTVTVTTNGDGGIEVSAGGKSVRTNPKLRPTVYYSFASSYFNVDNSGSLATYCQLYMVPAKFSAVRIRWPHMGGNGALSGLRMVVAATEDIGDLSLTNTAAGKRFITPYKNGAEQNALSFDGWASVTWGGAATASAQDLGADKIDIATSDWIPVQALPLVSDPSSRFFGWYALLIRVYPGAGYFSRCSYAGFSDTTKFLAECGPAVVMGANRGGGDHVATLANWNAASTPGFGDSSVLPAIIEAYTTARESSIMMVGDSRFASAPTAEGTVAYRTLMTKIEQAAVADGKKTRVLRCAQGGKTTAVFNQRAAKILDSGIQPNVSVYLAYSINDGSPTEATLAAAKSLALQHVDRCVQLGIQPVILSIFPTTGGFGTQYSRAVEFEQFVASLGVPWLSPLQIYGDGATGAWSLAGWNEDANHMTPAGYTDLAARIYALVKPYI